MAVAFPVLPPAPGELDLPLEVRVRIGAAWAASWEPLREDLRASVPAIESADERVVLVRAVRVLHRVAVEHQAEIWPVLRPRFAAALESLIETEEPRVPPLRRLGLRLLEDAVRMLSQFFEAITVAAPASAAIPPALPESDELLDRMLDPASVAVLRLELSVFVAFDLVHEESHEEFLLWARRAHESAQRAAPYVALVARASRPLDAADADVPVSPASFDRIAALTDQPPAPSTRLRELLRRGHP